MTGWRSDGIAICLPLALLVACWPAIGAAAATLQITVRGVRSDRGTLRIGVCREQEFLTQSCALHAVIPARRGETATQIAGIPPGQYGIAVFQDRDGSGKLKRDFIGVPQEDLGFSRDPALTFGPPSFSRSVITVGRDDLRIAVTLRHFGT